MNRLCLLGMIVIFSLSCRDHHTYIPARFPETPVNMDTFNTEYDDYNSALPIIAENVPFCFSTNRFSLGGQYDLAYYVLNIWYDWETGKFYLGPDKAYLWANYETLSVLASAMPVINTSFNEFGPYIISWDNFTGAWQDNNRFLFFYASDSAGNLDIKFTQNIDRADRFVTPVSAKVFNSAADDAYPTYCFKSDELFFCSNREGTFHIYKIAVQNRSDILNLLLGNTAAEIVKDTTLSSEYNDKFPFTTYDVMVFASDRPGGFGGYDLYYSVRHDSAWSAPENMGPAVNTEYDECRPVLVSPGAFLNDMVVFSSNRPGGKGGFDLYYVGVPRHGSVFR